jgi:hypothetical protein
VGFLVITDDVNLNEMIELIEELDPFKQPQPAKATVVSAKARPATRS